MHPYKRSIRLGDLIREEVAEIIMHRMRDPRLGFVTVTYARISDDLRHATIYLSVFEDSKKKDTLNILKASASFIRGELAKKLKIKYIPSLTFMIDESIEQGLKIDRLLDEVRTGDEIDDEDTI
ncbi:MAG: 30S ribosome-binding factor RbfA [Thermodesulfovibrionia bacterium]